MKAVFPHVSLDTVYRNLELLREAGLVSQINLQSRESARFELQKERGAPPPPGLPWAAATAICLPACPVDLDSCAPSTRTSLP